MKIKTPEPLFYEGGDTAILLLHSFTGTVRDVKALAKDLNNKGYTCLVPAYPGHGLPIESFIQYDIDDWYLSAVNAYKELKSNYHQVYVTGVSLGGLFTLKIAENFSVDKIAIMSVPMKKDLEGLQFRIANYAERMYKTFGMQFEMSEPNSNQIQQYTDGLNKFISEIDDIMAHLNQIDADAFVLYGERDEQSYEESAKYIHEQLKGSTLKAYANSGHLMTHSRDKEEVSLDILQFFN